MKFKHKPTIIEAEQYKLGMEDGFETRFYNPKKPHITFGIPTEDENKCVEVPYIYMCKDEPLRGYYLLSNTISNVDWIITKADGERVLCKADIFERLYEVIEE